MRAFAEAAYGIPPEQVIGSSGKTRFEGASVPSLVKLAEIGSVDDGPGKPQNIELHIGRRPILAFGNSDGDLQMLQWTTASRRPNLELLLHHDDAGPRVRLRPPIQDRTLDKAWDEALARKWTVVGMKNDWNAVFPAAGR
ncbi:MAG: hypothetical protein WDN45_11730 [Caulobacteraceae bacterium]